MSTPTTSTSGSSSSGSSSSDKKDTSNLDAKASASALGREDGLTTSTDTFENPDKVALGRLVTSVDPAGIERIVAPLPTGWQPAPVSATDEQIEAAKAHEKYLEQAKKDREAVWNNDDDKTEKVPNNPGDGASVTKAS